MHKNLVLVLPKQQEGFTIKLYDTSSLLILDELPKEHFKISSITLSELENIKTSHNKDEATKYAARRVVRDLWNNSKSYDVVNYNDIMDAYFSQEFADYEITNDIKILLCALYDNDIETLVTNDLSLANIANKTSIKVERAKVIDRRSYLGYTEKTLTDEEANDLFSQPDVNTQNLLNNEYIILKGADCGKDVVRCWRSNKYSQLSYHPYDSKYMVEVQPKDIYQKMAADALAHNQFVMLTGKAGTAKTLLALSHAMYEIEHGTKSKLIVFANPVAAMNAAEIGFLKGDKNEKLLDSSIGNILAAKLGGRDNVEKLIGAKKLELLTFADLRGYDTTGMNAVVLITEAQNLDRYLLQLAIQRIGEDCQLIVEGDYTTQVDNYVYAGGCNGMRRVSEIFRGYPDYAQVELKNIYRSGIAKKALEM